MSASARQAAIGACVFLFLGLCEGNERFTLVSYVPEVVASSLAQPAYIGALVVSNGLNQLWRRPPAWHRAGHVFDRAHTAGQDSQPVHTAALLPSRH